MKTLLALVISLCAGLAASRAGWPARVFAPYVYLGADDHFQITQCADACGQKFYTLAFIIADPHHLPAWDGRFPLAENLYGEQIRAIRERGGDVIASFGGEGGTELALAETNAAALETKYQSVITQYQLTRLDFDIEGDALHQREANERRNTALASLQLKNPGLTIAYTLPVDPDGIPKAAQQLLADAKAKGVRVHCANVMTMDFGAHFSAGKKMSEVAIASVIKAREQCQQIDPALQIGITAMIGQNDQHGEVFTPADAQALKDWAEAQPWVCSLSFWASNRDAGKPGKHGNDNTTSGLEQKPWDFTLIFKTFTTGH